jgi:hypothetical protein
MFLRNEPNLLSSQIAPIREHPQSEEAAAGVEIFGPVARPNWALADERVKQDLSKRSGALESAGAGVKTSPSATSPAMRAARRNQDCDRRPAHSARVWAVLRRRSGCMPTVNVPARFQKSVGAAWADVIKVSIYRAAEMTRVKLCEAAQITANPLAFSLGCAVD